MFSIWKRVGWKYWWNFLFLTNRAQNVILSSVSQETAHHNTCHRFLVSVSFSYQLCCWFRPWLCKLLCTATSMCSLPELWVFWTHAVFFLPPDSALRYWRLFREWWRVFSFLFPSFHLLFFFLFFCFGFFVFCLLYCFSSKKINIQWRQSRWKSAAVVLQGWNTVTEGKNIMVACCKVSNYWENFSERLFIRDCNVLLGKALRNWQADQLIYWKDVKNSETTKNHSNWKLHGLSNTDYRLSENQYSAGSLWTYMKFGWK